jgi:hypothetical protein
MRELAENMQGGESGKRNEGMQKEMRKPGIEPGAQRWQR